MTTTQAMRVTCSGCDALHAKRDGARLVVELGHQHTYITMGATRVTWGDSLVRIEGGKIEIICGRRLPTGRCSHHTLTVLDNGNII